MILVYCNARELECPDQCICTKIYSKKWSLWTTDVQCIPKKLNDVTDYSIPMVGTLAIRCSGQDTEDIKRSIVGRTSLYRSLTIRCVLSSVSSKTLQSMNNLQDLYMSSRENSILYPPNFLAKAPYLKTLSLTNNAGGTMPSLCRSKNLQQLELYKNYKSLEFLGLNCSNKGWPDLTELNLAFNTIDTFPSRVLHSSEKLEIIDLSYNRLHSIDDLINTTCFSLTHLDISHNNIVAVSIHTFNYCTQLVSLKINGNHIIEIESRAFIALISLKVLNLNEIMIHDKDVNNLSHIPKVLELDLNRNPISWEKDICLNSPHLKKLDISMCRIRVLKAYAFRCFGNLSVLNLFKNNITWIDRNAFAGLRHLYTLHLGANSIMTISDNELNLPNLRKLYLSDNNLSMFPYLHLLEKLSYLDISYNQLTNLTKGQLGSLQKLTELHLNNNQLNNFPMSVLIKFVKLKILKLDNNQLSELPFASASKSLESVQHCYIANNSLVSVDMELVPRSIETLDLSNNYISSIHNEQSFSRGAYVNLKYNRLDSFSLPQFETSLGGNILTCDCHMVWLIQKQASQYVNDLSEVKCRLYNGSVYSISNGDSNLREEDFLCRVIYPNCPKSCLCFQNSNNNIHLINCSSSGLNIIPNWFPSSAKIILLNGNDIKQLHGKSFANLSKLEVLRIKNCNVTNILPDTFNNMNKLHTLDLSSNRIEQLTTSLFEGLTSLKELYLDGNIISDVQAGALHLPSLEKLDMCNNNVIQMNEEQLLFVFRIVHICLSNNPWSCECNFIKKFKKILDQSIDERKDIDNNTDIKNISCKSVHKTENVLELELADYCRIVNVYDLIYEVIAATVFLCIVTVSIYIRRDLIILFAFTKCHWKPRRRVGEVDVQTYDAFVSYSDEDEDFVQEELVPELEGPCMRFKLCIRNRDWNQGASILYNMSTSIESSRTCIMVISDNYIEDNWCRFEFDTAYCRFIDEGGPRVLPIVLSRVDRGRQFRSLGLYTRSRLTLRRDERWFWNKLRLALTK